MTNLKAAYLDIDHTLFDSSRMGERFMDLAEEKLQWPAAEVAGIVEQLRDQLFNWKKFYDHLPARWRAQITYKDFRQLVKKNFADTRDCLYPDALPLLQRLREADWRSFICTFGDRHFQTTYKVLASGLSVHIPPENIICTALPGQKHRKIKENDRRLGVRESLFVDDNEQEILNFSLNSPAVTDRHPVSPAEIKHKTRLYLLDRSGTRRPDMEKTADLRYNYLNNLDQLPL